MSDQSQQATSSQEPQQEPKKRRNTLAALAKLPLAEQKTTLEEMLANVQKKLEEEKTAKAKAAAALAEQNRIRTLRIAGDFFIDMLKSQTIQVEYEALKGLATKYHDQEIQSVMQAAPRQKTSPEKHEAYKQKRIKGIKSDRMLLYALIDKLYGKTPKTDENAPEDPQAKKSIFDKPDGVIPKSELKKQQQQ